jgi:exodeoxyribonuclease V alpha subunit
VTAAVLPALRAAGLLGEFTAAGVLSAADVHVAQRVARLGGEPDERVQLGLALAVRALRNGSVCVDLAGVRDTVIGEDTSELVELQWPRPEEWFAACEASPLVACGVDAGPGRPLRLVQGLLYLDRYWRDEEQVRSDLLARAVARPPEADLGRARAALVRLFPGEEPDRQRLAAAVSALRWVTVLAGGPGTGKTTTVARLLALLHDQPGRRPRIALAAPTGKAAARLEESVQDVARTLPDADRAALAELRAVTLHRLLGRRGDSHTRFRHDRANRLPYDVVVVDETSMVPLTLMARLLEALPRDARLVLVGDPDQLASVEAGTVLGDLVRAEGLPRPGFAARLSELGGTEAAANGVVTLEKVWRFGGSIAPLARAIQDGDADTVLGILRARKDDVEFVETGSLEERHPAGLNGLRDDVERLGRELTAAAETGDVDAALSLVDTHRLLCAHRTGPYGVARWSAQAEAWLSAAGPREGEWYPGRPLLVTATDYDVGLYNGDVGVVIRAGDGVRAAFARGGAAVLVPPVRLAAVQSMYAMTVHRGQGSQFARVSFLLPPAGSPLLTRELLYTAVTRATSFIRVVGSAEAVRAAVQRPIARASGLRNRLVM